ncbi:MAG: GIY-YIG nuclease family protein [Bacteroidetes bacterium]|nr:GIY-YIG nuclease family protein [Bacteroidota bacterium]
MTHFVYILYSKKYNKYYTGTSKELERRLKEHNSGKTKSTKPYKPWEIIYIEEYNSEAEAYKREKYLKSGSGREFIKGLILPP